MRVAVLTMALLIGLSPAARAADAVDLIVVEKAERRLILYSHGRPVAAYRVRLGQDPIGPKTVQGDSRTPEGDYVVSGRNAGSAYYRALALSYPNATDKARARRAGVAPGGDIAIHGLPNDWPWFYPLHLLFDWTDGCVAVGDGAMAEIWPRVAVGTRVEIRP